MTDHPTLDSVSSTGSTLTQPVDTVAESVYSTVIAEFTRDNAQPHPTGKQSEAELEEMFMDALVPVGYERVVIRDEDGLLKNLRVQLERLNRTTYSDAEFTQIIEVHLANPTMTRAEKTRLIQSESPLVTITRDDGTKINVKLLDKRDLTRNHLQVTNQYRATTASTKKNQRYDVTILVNGLPMVHIELKRRGVSLREAFRQINRYQQSFSAGKRFFDYVQLFVISNGTDTRYYSNTTREMAVKANDDGRGRSGTGDMVDKSFEFSSYWALTDNRVINDLMDFAATFMVKRTLLNILTRYCIFDASENLLVMRPYQIAATEAILTRIRATANTKLLGTPEAGGYIWHTTGSGKTLTSFKTAQLATLIPGIDKVIFAVDRQDLDYQTVKEYERFQKGAVSSNVSTKVLERQLNDPVARIIVTTIQKLNTYVAGKAKNSRYPGHVVLIFDECHRSQFGSMHQKVAEHFNKRHSFGFTGTPIFEEIARKDLAGRVFTTEAVFGKRLHAYTVVDAIRDRNVLRFDIRSHSTMVENVQDNPDVRSIDAESALLAPKRIATVTGHILEQFPLVTKRSSSFIHNISIHDRSTDQTTSTSRRVGGFNALLATASIPAARAYYAEFKRQQEGVTDPLKVAMIYSQSGRQDAAESAAGAITEESYDVDSLSGDDKTAFEQAVDDYNAMFGTSFEASSAGYENYYKDLSQRIRNREVDLTIVVNIFLTGFDAPALNTLFVDKNLRHHGLIQAFSRTNRILNPIKDKGVIVTYRDLADQTDEALTLFGGSGKSGAKVAVVRPYAELLEEYLATHATVREIATPGEAIHSEKDQREFVEVFSQLLRLHNVLSTFSNFEDDNPLAPLDLADYMSRYLQIRDDQQDPVEPDDSRVDISGDLEFEIELVRHIAVTLDYITELIQRAREKDNGPESGQIRRLIGSSPSLRPKRDLILAFLDRVNGTGYDGSLIDYLREEARTEITTTMTDLGMTSPKAYDFVAGCFTAGTVGTSGKTLVSLLPPTSLFGGSGQREVQKTRAVDAINSLIERFADVIPEEEIRKLG